MNRRGTHGVSQEQPPLKRLPRGGRAVAYLRKLADEIEIELQREPRSTFNPSNHVLPAERVV